MPSKKKAAATAAEWLAKARDLLAPKLPEGSVRTIAQVLRNHATLKDVLSVPLGHGHPARTIHSVKGAEFPAVCLVISPATAKSTFDFLVLRQIHCDLLLAAGQSSDSKLPA